MLLVKPEPFPNRSANGSVVPHSNTLTAKQRGAGGAVGGSHDGWTWPPPSASNLSEITQTGTSSFRNRTSDIFQHPQVPPWTCVTLELGSVNTCVMEMAADAAVTDVT